MPTLELALGDPRPEGPGEGTAVSVLRPASAFTELGFAPTVEALLEEIRELYLADTVPWVVGYSGGKDSTAITELVWIALASLPPEQRHKSVHVISTDTLVENPVVAAWAGNSLEAMRVAADAAGLPIQVHRLTPALEDSFWVCLIGRGYPAPRHKFRWCTERLKIKPSNAFINSLVSANGAAILVLGTRKAESVARARVMTRLEVGRVRDRLSPNAGLPGSLVYSPIEAWANDDVWIFLMQVKNPWGWSNKSLLTMYQGATEGGECPLVVDTTTPSCGSSRFGCWTCTMVEQDKSMAAMISNDAEKEWMLPLLELRNALDLDDDRHLRDFRRLRGHVQLFHGRTVHGPYLQEVRADWLRRLLVAQGKVRELGPPEMAEIELISLRELDEVRRIWLDEKHEAEDLLPGIYRETTGEEYPGIPRETGPFGAEDLALLREACDGDRHLYEMTRALLGVERRQSTFARRARLFPELEAVFRRYQYATEEEATAALQVEAEQRAGVQLGIFPPGEGAPPPGLSAARFEEAARVLEAFVTKVGAEGAAPFIASVRAAIPK